MSYKVEEYLRENGTSPYEEWFMSLDSVAAAKITTVKLKMEQGNLPMLSGFGALVNTSLIGGPVIEFTLVGMGIN